MKRSTTLILVLVAALLGLVLGGCGDSRTRGPGSDASSMGAGVLLESGPLDGVATDRGDTYPFEMRYGFLAHVQDGDVVMGTTLSGLFGENYLLVVSSLVVSCGTDLDVGISPGLDNDGATLGITLNGETNASDNVIFTIQDGVFQVGADRSGDATAAVCDPIDPTAASLSCTLDVGIGGASLMGDVTVSVCP